MTEKGVNCFYYQSLRSSPSIRDLISRGRASVNGDRWCDYKTPATESEIPPEGVELSCVGQNSPDCPIFQERIKEK